MEENNNLKRNAVSVKTIQSNKLISSLLSTLCIHLIINMTIFFKLRFQNSLLLAKLYILY